ncbi:MAG: TetR family transcriptional regulator [Desulfobacteraceae bacterium]|nr:TetR family transcriptional regulator [Desulfobacteraceae bacterium]
MGRPRKSEHTRQKLLEKGVTLLSEHGYHGCGLKKILDTVQVPKGSFYNYFESKEAYVSEIIQFYSHGLIMRMDAYLEASTGDPVTTIRNLYTTVADELEAHGRLGCLIGNLAAELGTSSNLCRLTMQQSFEAWKNRIVPLIKAGQEGGQIRDDLSAESLTDMFWSTWQGGLLRMKIYGDAEHLRDLLHVILDVLFVPCGKEPQPDTTRKE